MYMKGDFCLLVYIFSVVKKIKIISTFTLTGYSDNFLNLLNCFGGTGFGNTAKY